ncbi:unnamed protein product [Rotaria sp. Silwood2]|nr:unnamed protein product [Rotaria sp. Silwood2]
MNELTSSNSANHSSHDTGLYKPIDNAICTDGYFMQHENPTRNLHQINIDDLPSLQQQSTHNDLKMDELNEHILQLSAYQTTDDLSGDVQRQDTPLTNERGPPFVDSQIGITQEQYQIMKQENDYLRLNNNLLQTQLMEQPATTDGLLIWLIPDSRKRINNALCLKERYLKSPMIFTAMNGHRMQAYLDLNGTTSNEYSSSLYISIYVRLLTPIYQNLKGTVTFCVVDQSNNDPQENIERTCPVDTMMANEMIGFDYFMLKNRLYQDPSRYIRHDNIWIIVKFNQTNAERFANLPSCVQNALENIG